MSFRKRLPARAVFNKVLSPSRAIPLSSNEALQERLPSGTAISQCMLRDGWIGIAFSDRGGETRVAGESIERK